MTNRVVGIIGSAVCSVSVLCFAVSMIVGIFVNTLFFSCFASMFIALGFMLFFMCAVVQGQTKIMKSVLAVM